MSGANFIEAPKGGALVQDAEKVLTSKYLWAGVAIAALVGGYFWVSGQLSAIANAGATDSTGGAALFPPTASIDPLSAVGATSSGGGYVGTGGVSDGSGAAISGPASDPSSAASSGSGGLDPNSLLQLEETQSNNVLALGLAQLGAQTAASQLAAQVSLAGLQVQQQGQNDQVGSSLIQALGGLFSKTGSKSTSMNQNLNGSFNVGGTPIGFNINLNNYQGGKNTTFATDVANQLGEDNAVSGQTFSSGNQSAGSTPGVGTTSVASGRNAASGVSSVVARARSNSL